MYKRVIFISLVSLSLTFTAIAGEYFAGEYFADATEALARLEQAEAAFKELIASFPEFEQAETYEKDGNYEQAEAIYKTVATDYPGTDYTLQARKRLTMLYITWGRPQEANAAFQELVASFSTHALIPGTVYRIAEHCSQLEKHERANQLYQYVVDNWPQQYYEMWAQLGVAVSNISLGDDATAKTAIDRLLADFYENDRIADAVYDIAHRYNRFGRCAKARQLYQYILDTWSDSEDVTWTKIGLAQANISLGDNTAAQTVIDSLVAKLNADFPDGTDLTHIAVDGYYYAGECYHKLDKCAKSTECYQKVVDRYPDYEYAWNAQFMVGRNYEDLKKSGVISKSEADAKIKAAYEQLLEKYPDCPAAKIARRWLNAHNSI